MDFWFIAYILISIVLGLGAVSYTYKRGQTIAAMLLLVLLIAIFVFYGLRWFQGGTLKGTTGTGGQWPPIVNVCPDFMSSKQVGSGLSGKIYCIDSKNIYGLQRMTTTSGKFVVASIENENSGLMMVDGTKGLKTDTLSADTAKDLPERRYPILSGLKASINGLLTTVPQMKDVRWEGVYDGTSATADKAPIPVPV
jgi:hypothetical protein